MKKFAIVCLILVGILCGCTVENTAPPLPVGDFCAEISYVGTAEVARPGGTLGGVRETEYRARVTRRGETLTVEFLSPEPLAGLVAEESAEGVRAFAAGEPLPAPAVAHLLGPAHLLTETGPVSERTRAGELATVTYLAGGTTRTLTEKGGELTEITCSDGRSIRVRLLPENPY